MKEEVVPSKFLLNAASSNHIMNICASGYIWSLVVLEIVERFEHYVIITFLINCNKNFVDGLAMSDWHCGHTKF